MNGHQAVLDWLLFNMKYDVEYRLNDNQIELIATVFEAFLMPTIPVKEYDYYFKFGEGYRSITKILKRKK